MGYNTTIMVINDALDVLEENPQDFMEGLVTGIHSADYNTPYYTFPVGNHCNPVTVVKTEHADTPRVYFTHHNSIIDISGFESNVTYWAGRKQLSHLKNSLKIAKREIKLLEAYIKTFEMKNPDYIEKRGE